MKCEACGTEFEGRFCPACGRPAAAAAGPLPAICARCGTSFAGNFCPNCGWPAGTPVPVGGTAGRTILGVVWLVAILLFVVYLGAVLAGLVLITPGIVQGIVLGTCGTCVAVFFWLTPFSPNLLGFVIVEGAGFGAWFFILLAIFFGIFLYLFFFHGRRTYRDMRLPPERIEQKLASRSPVVAVGQVFMAILFFDIIYLTVILPLGFGIRPESPDFPGPLWYFLYLVVNAAVWEELVTRVLLIGLPMALGALVLRLPNALYGPRPEGMSRGRYVAGSLKYLFGGHVREGSSKDAILVGAVLVFVSAAIFGYLHVEAWGAWKFVDTFLAGLALGYLFLRHGLFASILLHLSVNSLSVLFEVSGAATNLGSAALLGILYLALVAFGSGFLAYYVKRTGSFLLRPLIGRRRAPAPAPKPRPSAANPGPDPLLFAVTCPRCGSHEARYTDGALLCLRCGTRVSGAAADGGRGQVSD